MGFGNGFQPQRRTRVRPLTTSERDFIRLQSAIDKKEERSLGKQTSPGFQRIRRTGIQTKRRVAQFGQAVRRQEPDFTVEQETLSQMFGGGEKIWGGNDAVNINHDLNPSQRGDEGTARLFGF